VSSLYPGTQHVAAATPGHAPTCVV